MGLSSVLVGRVVELENQSMNVIHTGRRKCFSSSSREEVKYKSNPDGAAQCSAVKNTLGTEDEMFFQDSLYGPHRIKCGERDGSYDTPQTGFPRWFRRASVIKLES